MVQALGIQGGDFEWHGDSGWKSRSMSARLAVLMCIGPSEEE